MEQAEEKPWLAPAHDVQGAHGARPVALQVIPGLHAMPHTPPLRE
jgi:hypothetical protein